MRDIPEDWRHVAESEPFLDAQEALCAAFHQQRDRLLAKVPLPYRIYLQDVQPRNFWPELENPPRDLRGKLIMFIAGYLRAPTEGGEMRPALSFEQRLSIAWVQKICGQLIAAQQRAIIDVAFGHHQEYLEHIMRQGQAISATNLLNIQQHCEKLCHTYQQAIDRLVRE
ncbi:MAG: hypothetical protein G01um101425_240 [Candidatus Peregrinibacteria bacterium Gr01-1014_25]|nr:MAG: hypothetical protein G01um101425_240 [Candidatus Peregrinibacteria bacterium Gr01-1014_25]